MRREVIPQIRSVGGIPYKSLALVSLIGILSGFYVWKPTFEDLQKTKGTEKLNETNKQIAEKQPTK